MGLLGKIIKRQSDEDIDDLDFDDEMVDSLDMPGEEGGSRKGLLGKVLKWRQKGEAEDTDEEEDEDEGHGNAEDPMEPEEDRPVQMVKLEAVPDALPVGDPGSGMIPGQDQTAPASGSAGSGAPSTGQPRTAPGDQPAANSSPGADDTPVDPAPDTDGDTDMGSSNTDGDDLSLDLQDIFGEEEAVNETLRDLADSVDDTPVQELADQLRELINQSQGGNYILERWQRHGRCKHQCVGSGL